jgi:hypothetical protein
MCYEIRTKMKNLTRPVHSVLALESSNGGIVCEMDMHEKLTRGGEIQQELEKLYAELGKFSDPTPADTPHEYEPEEIEAFEELKERIRSLEADLEKITNYRQ